MSDSVSFKPGDHVKVVGLQGGSVHSATVVAEIQAGELYEVRLGGEGSPIPVPVSHLRPADWHPPEDDGEAFRSPTITPLRKKPYDAGNRSGSGARVFRKPHGREG